MNIFKNNELLLLFLLENQIITIDDLFDEYQKDECGNGKSLCHFFFPEIKHKFDVQNFEKIEKELLAYDSNIFANFQEKRIEGENCSYICSLIRQDSIKEFVLYVNEANVCLSNKIERSIFETNSFLKANEPTLIEYAAFFGSIKIFNFLRRRRIELTPSLWLYSIHSNNIHMFHLIEELNVAPPNDSYETCLFEAIKCHHNEIARYIENNLVNENDVSELNANIVDCSFCHDNYLYLPEEFTENYLLFYYCKYDYMNFVDFHLEMRKEEIENFII